MQTAIPDTVPTTAIDMPRRRVLGAYLEEARSECLRYMRNPGFMLPIMLFPAMFYLLFGVLMARSNGAEAARYLLASYGTFGVMSPGLFGFGVSLALERDGGLMALKRALPMPPGAYLLGKMLMAMAAAAVVIQLRISDEPELSFVAGMAHSASASLRLQASSRPRSSSSSTVKWLKPPEARIPTRALPGAALTASRIARPNS